MVAQAIEDAKQNAKLNEIENAEFFVGESEKVFVDYYREHPEESPDVVVVDPPRKGCDQTLLESIIRVKPNKVVYVSCDSATLARDLKILCEAGYMLQEVKCPGTVDPELSHM